MNESMCEIAYSNTFICPHQESVNILRDENKKGLLGKDKLEDFVILKVPQKVAHILNDISYKTYAGIIKGEITTEEIIRSAMVCAGYIVLQPKKAPTAIDKTGGLKLKLSRMFSPLVNFLRISRK